MVIHAAGPIKLCWLKFERLGNRRVFEAYIMVRLRKETPIIMAQLGIALKSQKKYPRGTATPYWARGPS